jgi:uncharacterized phage protein (TIGR01671 family)
MNIPKFRAWLIEAKLMLDAHTINFHDKEVYFGETEHGEEILFPFDEIILMQSTGLFDKNGVEIFEGDIVRWDDMTNGKKWRVAVVETKPSLQFKIVHINCDFEQSCKAGYIFHFGNFRYKDTHNHFEIIGNIHANSELLEQAE